MTAKNIATHLSTAAKDDRHGPTRPQDAPQPMRGQVRSQRPPAASRRAQLTSSGGGAPSLHASAHVVDEEALYWYPLIEARLRCTVC